MLKDFGCQGSAVYKSPSKYLSLEFLKSVKDERYCSHDANGNLKEYCADEVDELINQKADALAEKFLAQADALETDYRLHSTRAEGTNNEQRSCDKQAASKPPKGETMQSKVNPFMRLSNESESAWCKRTKFYGSKEAMKGMNKMHKDFQRFMGKKNVKTLTEKDLVFVPRKAVL